MECGVCIADHIVHVTGIASPKYVGYEYPQQWETDEADYTADPRLRCKGCNYCAAGHVDFMGYCCGKCQYYTEDPSAGKRRKHCRRCTKQLYEPDKNSDGELTDEEDQTDSDMPELNDSSASEYHPTPDSDTDMSTTESDTSTGTGDTHGVFAQTLDGSDIPFVAYADTACAKSVIGEPESLELINFCN